MVGAEENVCHDDNLYDHVLTCNVLFNLTLYDLFVFNGLELVHRVLIGRQMELQW